MKKVIWMFAFILVGLLLPLNTVEAKPANVEAWQEGSGQSAVVKLKWKFTTGDRLFRTFDGDNWTQLTIPTADSNGFVEVSDNNGGTGFVNGSNVFYEVRDSNYQNAWNGQSRIAPEIQATFKAITVYIGSGSSTLDSAHGNYVSNTNTCATCHRSHKGQGQSSQLLTTSSDRALCDTCHTSSQIGSKYLVDEGVVKNNTGILTSSAAGPLSARVHTSAHSGRATAPGDSLNPGKVWDMESCITCHQAHPKDNSFRLLKSVNKTGDGQVMSVPVEAYAVNNGITEIVRYKSGISQNCAQCHNIFNPSSTGSTTVHYGGETFFVHPVDKGMRTKNEVLTTSLPIQNNSNISTRNPNDQTIPSYENNSVLTCVTCHFGHGTTKTGQQQSSFNNGFSTMLKRMDNQAMCQDCHKK